MHTRDPRGQRLLVGTFVPMLDVSSLSMTFCPGQEYPINPNYLSPLCPPPPGQRRSREWSWQRLEHPPFQDYNVTSYAVHPQRCTSSILQCTYVGKTLALPFSGRGHFDPHLDAFVGLFKDPDTLGQVYSCCLSSSSTGKTVQPGPAERHVGATLVYMGRSKFCLVQCVSIEGESDEGDVSGPVCRAEDWGADQELMEEGYIPGCCLYRLTTFSLSYDINGDLTTGNSCRVLYYRPYFVEDPVAFCM
ncbi:hypothetical protein VPH35_124104 [Triticum aestivum]